MLELEETSISEEVTKLITFKKGNLLEDPAEALVNTVNTVGVMGKGMALQFKQAFPDVYKQYEKDCKADKVHIGKMHVVSVEGIVNPKYIINFPTKKHWRNPSQLQYIESGLEDLIYSLHKLNIHSVAIPPLGCGNGGLDWLIVREKIISAFEDQQIHVSIYEPAGSPPVSQTIVRTKQPNMTKGRALLLSLMDNYAIPGYRLSLLEVQKLAYFLKKWESQ